MIKRLVLVQRRSDADPAAFAAAVRAGAQQAAACELASPLRVSVAFVDAERTPGVPRHDAMVIAWFADGVSAQQHESLVPADAIAGPHGSRPVEVMAHEAVLRGEAWLADRWQHGGMRLKHVALAQRAEGLSPAEHASRWKAQAGAVSTASAAVAIPPEAKGSAYVQNHPLPRDDGEWAYDAVNEVYLEDDTALARRLDWFAANVGEGTGVRDSLVRASWFLVLHEEPVTAPER